MKKVMVQHGLHGQELYLNRQHGPTPCMHAHICNCGASINTLQGARCLLPQRQLQRKTSGKLSSLSFQSGGGEGVAERGSEEAHSWISILVSEIEPFIPGILDGDTTFEAYLERMSHPAAWGGEGDDLSRRSLACLVGSHI